MCCLLSQARWLRITIPTAPPQEPECIFLRALIAIETEFPTLGGRCGDVSYFMWLARRVAISSVRPTGHANTDQVSLVLTSQFTYLALSKSSQWSFPPGHHLKADQMGQVRWCFGDHIPGSHPNGSAQRDWTSPEDDCKCRDDHTRQKLSIPHWTVFPVFPPFPHAFDLAPSGS